MKNPVFNKWIKLSMLVVVFLISFFSVYWIGTVTQKERDKQRLLRKERLWRQQQKNFEEAQKANWTSCTGLNCMRDGLLKEGNND